MSSQSPLTEDFRYLPQLSFDRNEDDSNIEHDCSTADILTIGGKTATSNAAKWQWKGWKQSQSTSPQRQKQRKHPLHGAVLTPLAASLSPGRPDANDLDEFIDRIADRGAATPPRTPKNAMTASPLPPLEAQILQRPRLFLDFKGHPTVVMDQLVRLQEYQEPTSPINALQLVAMPKKCLKGDEVALMPCHSMQHRGFPQLSDEHWREPVRDRNKNWVQDELASLLRRSQQRQTPSWKMTRAPGATNRGKWTRHEEFKPQTSTTPAWGEPVSPVSTVRRPQRILMTTQGLLISRSYCVVSIYGEGIYGRLYGAGLTGKNKHRCLHVEAYEAGTSRTYHVAVTLEDLEWVFRVGGNDPDRESLLAPGRKKELLRQLISLLFFEYPVNEKAGPPILRLSPEVQLNEATLRRLEREEQLRQEEARRLADLSTLMAKPRRARHRVLCQPIKLRGHRFYVSVHHFPAQARNLIITAYNPNASMTFRLAIGLLEAASLVKLYPLPRSGFSPEQTLAVARGLLSVLKLHGRESSSSNARMMLAISGGRQGPGMSALPLLPPMPTEELKHEEMAVKMQRDARRALQLELAMVRSCLHNDAEAERVEIRQKIAELQEKREAFVEKDDALKTRIEEIDAIGGGGDNNPGLKILRDERRMHKTTRQAYKVEMKSLSTQLAELNKKLQSVSEKEKATDERAQRRTDRARKRLRDEVNRNLTDNVRLIVPVKVRPPIGQRVWLLRAHMQPGWRFVVTGGCRISGKYVRYSLFAPEPVSEENSDGVDNDELFRLELYDAATCLCSENIVVSKLEWLALTKSHHEQQLLVPELAPVDSDVVKRLAELHEMLNEARQAFHHAKDTSSGVTSKGKTAKAKTSSKTKREELRGKMATASSEINKLHREAPWAVLVKALCERITLTSMPTATAYELALDRCIFRSTTAILRVSNDENEEGDGEPSVVYCRVRVEISALALAVIFMVWDPLSATEWRLEYPESRELVREFVVETFTEQQMHLEAIVMSLLLHLNTDTGQLELRFEE